MTLRNTGLHLTMNFFRDFLFWFFEKKMEFSVQLKPCWPKGRKRAWVCRQALGYQQMNLCKSRPYSLGPWVLQSVQRGDPRVIWPFPGKSLQIHGQCSSAMSLPRMVWCLFRAFSHCLHCRPLWASLAQFRLCSSRDSMQENILVSYETCSAETLATRFAMATWPDD